MAGWLSVRRMRQRAPESGCRLDAEALSAQSQKRGCRGRARSRARRLVGDQQLQHHLARPWRARWRWSPPCPRSAADAGGGQHPLALDLDHAGAAVAVGAVARLRRVAEMRDLDALALGHLPDGLAGRASTSFLPSSVKVDRWSLAHGQILREVFSTEADRVGRGLAQAADRRVGHGL